MGQRPIGFLLSLVMLFDALQLSVLSEILAISLREVVGFGNMVGTRQHNVAKRGHKPQHAELDKNETIYTTS
jgi:hypothetical protein